MSIFSKRNQNERDSRVEVLYDINYLIMNDLRLLSLAVCSDTFRLIIATNFVSFSFQIHIDVAVFSIT